MSKKNVDLNPDLVCEQMIGADLSEVALAFGVTFFRFSNSLTISVYWRYTLLDVQIIPSVGDAADSYYDPQISRKLHEILECKVKQCSFIEGRELRLVFSTGAKLIFRIEGPYECFLVSRNSDILLTGRSV